MRVPSIVRFDKAQHRTPKSIAGKCDWAEVEVDHDALWTVEAEHERAPNRTYAFCTKHLHDISLPRTEASNRLGHDHACALLIDGWSSPQLDLQRGLLAGR